MELDLLQFGVVEVPSQEVLLVTLSNLALANVKKSCILYAVCGLEFSFSGSAPRGTS